jgi:hypothetical protein
MRLAVHWVILGFVAWCFFAGDNWFSYCGRAECARGRARFLGDNLAAPKGRDSPSPGHRPGKTGPIEPVSSAQRANRSVNRWPVGPINGIPRSVFPGRCPGLGERLGLRPTRALQRNLATPSALAGRPESRPADGIHGMQQKSPSAERNPATGSCGYLVRRRLGYPSNAAVSMTEAASPVKAKNWYSGHFYSSWVSWGERRIAGRRGEG